MLNYEEYQAQSQLYGTKLREFVGPLLVEMDKQLDKRLVRTFLKTLEAVITFRHSVYGLLVERTGRVHSVGRACSGRDQAVEQSAQVKQIDRQADRRLPVEQSVGRGRTG